MVRKIYIFLPKPTIRRKQEKCLKVRIELHLITRYRRYWVTVYVILLLRYWKKNVGHFFTASCRHGWGVGGGGGRGDLRGGLAEQDFSSLLRIKTVLRLSSILGYFCLTGCMAQRDTNGGKRLSSIHTSKNCDVRQIASPVTKRK
jgi:hypothetical protein